MLNTAYFKAGSSWQQRLDLWLEGVESTPFRDANRKAITRCLEDPRTGLRMVVNIPADALLRFLRSGCYLNAYDEPIVGGKRRTPSQTRRDVDSWLELNEPKNYYFGAVAAGGTGVRFYGEYCMVLRREKIPDHTRIFDRNSYDLTRPPFDTMNKKEIVESLRGTWSADLIHMLVLKSLPMLTHYNWLVTLGTISDMILHDEEFTEVHLEGNFGPKDLEEIRQAPEDETIDGRILAQYSRGIAPTASQILWSARRVLVDRVLFDERIPTRVVASSGRGSRWK